MEGSHSSAALLPLDVFHTRQRQASVPLEPLVLGVFCHKPQNPNCEDASGKTAHLVLSSDSQKGS